MNVSLQVKEDEWIELILDTDDDTEWLALRRWLDEYIDGKNAGIELRRTVVVSENRNGKSEAS